jgi:hypothetical protein
LPIGPSAWQAARPTRAAERSSPGPLGSSTRQAARCGTLGIPHLVAGHRSIQTTQRYIDGDSDAQRKLVAMI